MRTRRARRCVALLLACALGNALGCSKRATPLSPDAGVAADAGRDAGLLVDAGVDAGPLSDAGADAGVLADGGGIPPPSCALVGAPLRTEADALVGGLLAGLRDKMRSYVASYAAPAGARPFTREGEAWTWLGQTGMLIDKLELMCAGYLQAAALEPLNALAVTNAATCLIARERWELAERCLTCALDLSPNHGPAFVNRATLAYVRDSDAQRALADVERAVAADPDYPEWRYQAFQLALELGDDAAVARHLAAFPDETTGYPQGYHGIQRPAASSPPTGVWCCTTADPPVTYSSLLDCQQCAHTLACLNPCKQSGQCTRWTALVHCICQTAALLPCKIKVCLPPAAPAQVCVSIDDDCNIAIEGTLTLAEIIELSVGAEANLNDIGKTAALTSGIQVGRELSGVKTGFGITEKNGKIKGAWEASAGFCNVTLKEILLSAGSLVPKD